MDTIKELRSRLTKSTEVNGEPPIGREEQYETLRISIRDSIAQQKGKSIYICGTPGTGKSLTVHSVLISLCTKIGVTETPPAVVSINCMSLTTPQKVIDAVLESYKHHASLEDAYQIYYLHQVPRLGGRDNAKEQLELLCNEDIPQRSQNQQQRKITGRKRTKEAVKDKIRGMIIVFLDEMDTLISKDTALVNELFYLAKSSRRLILIGASNCLDLTERLESQSVPNIITFAAYTANEVASVLKAVTSEFEEQIISDRAIEYLSRKASTSGMGDMRNVFQIFLTSLSSTECSLTEGKNLIDVKDLIEIFDGADLNQTNSKMDTFGTLPLDQQVLLFAIYQQKTEASEKQKEPSSKRRLSASQRALLNPLNVVNIYQKYSEICQTLCMDCSSKADVASMIAILEDLGFISKERNKTQTNLNIKISEETIREFFSTKRFFVKLL